MSKVIQHQKAYYGPQNCSIKSAVECKCTIRLGYNIVPEDPRKIYCRVVRIAGLVLHMY